MTAWFSEPRDEAEAHARAAAGWVPRLLLGCSAGLRLAFDPHDTQQVFYLATSLDRDNLPRALRRLATDEAGRELLRKRPAIDGHTIEQLRALPPDTLGGAYARMLAANGLDADLFQRPPALPDDLAYVAQRMRQTHDLWHVLTGLGTDVRGEIALQAFTYAQLRLRFSLLLATFGVVFFGLRDPDTLRLTQYWYRRGRELPYLLAVAWEDLWTARLDDVRRRLGLREFAATAQTCPA
jgi:ubiquinone biosynthesis protein Coq4